MEYSIHINAPVQNPVENKVAPNMDATIPIPHGNVIGKQLS